MPDVVNTWDNVQNTSCWVHDGSPWETDGVVERSAADIVELASAAQRSANRAQASADAAGGYADAASGYADSASGYADNASASADSIISGGYVTSADVSDVVDDAISSGGFVTSSGASAITSAYITSGGYATSAGVSAIISSGGYATSAWVSGQGYATSAYVSGATVSSAGVAGKIGTATVGSTTKPVYISAGVPVSMSVVASATIATNATSAGNAATATDASSLGGVAASSYALDANVVKLSGDQNVGGVKTFSGTILSTNNDIALRRTDTTGALRIAAGTDVGGSTGAFLTMFGAGHSNAQYFRLCAGPKWLEGRPDGTLTWQGQPVQTSSDERLKTSLDAVPDAVLDAWGEVGWGQFRYLDAVAKKGADKARLHLGLIAQRVKAIFEARGLDVCAYGILCHEEHPATDVEPAVDLWTVRYTEAAAMEAAYQRRRADRAEARITALERRLDEMEAVFAALDAPVEDAGE